MQQYSLQWNGIIIVAQIDLNLDTLVVIPFFAQEIQPVAIGDFTFNTDTTGRFDWIMITESPRPLLEHVLGCKIGVTIRGFASQATT